VARSRSLDDETHRTRGVRLAPVEGQHHEGARQAVGGCEMQRVEGSNLVPAAELGSPLEAGGIEWDDVTALPILAKTALSGSALARIEAQPAQRDLGFGSSD
jgi:hypothetical protein